MPSLSDHEGIYDRTAGAMRLSFMGTRAVHGYALCIGSANSYLIYNAPKAEMANTNRGLCPSSSLGIHQVTTGILQGLGKPRIPKW